VETGVTVTRTCRVVVGLLAAGAVLPATAQDYPARPLRLVVPYPPGGTSDILARPVAQALGERLGQPVVVDNRGGANGNIGTEVVARSPADGYTLLFCNTSHTINPGLYAKVPYDPLKDFTGVALLASTPLILVVHPSIPAANVRELVRVARARPGQLNFSSAGSGSTAHLSGELFKTTAGVDMVHVPYKGSGMAVSDLLGGQISLTFGGLVPTLPHTKTGRLRALAVTGAGRSSIAPDIPTVGESGLPGFVVNPWFGVLAPAQTPPAAVARLHADLAALMRSQDITTRYAAQGADIVVQAPAAFDDFIKAEIAKWAKIVRVSGARAD
jgi:tripartite-type tricarboxylate transporter receptor subunit TctC